MCHIFQATKNAGSCCQAVSYLIIGEFLAPLLHLPHLFCCFFFNTFSLSRLLYVTLLYTIAIYYINVYEKKIKLFSSVVFLYLKTFLS